MNPNVESRLVTESQTGLGPAQSLRLILAGSTAFPTPFPLVGSLFRIPDYRLSPLGSEMLVPAIAVVGPTADPLRQIRIIAATDPAQPISQYLRAIWLGSTFPGPGSWHLFGDIDTEWNKFPEPAAGVSGEPGIVFVSNTTPVMSLLEVTDRGGGEREEDTFERIMCCAGDSACLALQGGCSCCD
jgi:hypothetical protein